jgi:hypothetical protein
LDLGDSNDHISQFGRMGFGFTKQFILEQGGSPVQYCLGTKDCDRVNDLAVVRRYLQTGKNKGVLDSATWQAFQRLAHFYKRTREVIKSRKAPSKPSRPKEPKIYRPKPSHEDTLATIARYNFQRAMPHLEETEWRLVFDEGHDLWHKNNGGDSPKTAWFHVEAGKDLQMLIVPDNRCYQLVHEYSCFTDRLFKIPKKPVQVISLEILERAY